MMTRSLSWMLVPIVLRHASRHPAPRSRRASHRDVAVEQRRYRAPRHRGERHRGREGRDLSRSRPTGARPRGRHARRHRQLRRASARRRDVDPATTAPAQCGAGGAGVRSPSRLLGGSVDARCRGGRLCRRAVRGLDSRQRWSQGLRRRGRRAGAIARPGSGVGSRRPDRPAGAACRRSALFGDV